MDKQKEILNAALKLFVEFGFHGTPTSKIAHEAGVANGTLFHYFKTKDELTVALYIDIKKRMAEEVGVAGIAGKAPSMQELFKEIFRQSLLWAQKNKPEFLFIQLFSASPFIHAISPEELEKSIKPHLDLFAKGIKSKIIKPMPVDFIFAIVSSFTYGINQYLLSNHFSSAKQKKVINESYELLWDMLTI